MTGFNFNNLLNSIGKPGSTPSPQPTTAISKPPATVPGTTKTPAATNGAPVSANLAAGIKRKSEDSVAGSQAKVMRTEVKVPVKPSQSSGQAASAKQSTSTASTAPYRGTLKAASSAQTVRPAAKAGQAAAKPAVATASTAPANGAAPAAPRGFAAIMAQAKAAQEANKAAGTNTIQHKPVERLTKKERMKLKEEAKQKGSTKGGKAAAVDRSRSGTPSDPKAAAKKAPPPTGYKGTMKAKPAVPASSYSGTMKTAVPGAAPKKDPKKGLGQDKYGGYASWSDLDDAEDDEEEGYDSYESDDMEAGFDDVDGEEQLALKSAKKEDLEALQEEERHKREKEERKRKLAALSKSAAAAKKKY